MRKTSYGWLIQVDGRLIEVATDEEARELLEEESQDSSFFIFYAR